MCSCRIVQESKQSQVLDAKVTSFADANCAPSTGTFRVLTVKSPYDAIVPTRAVAGVQSNCHLLCGSVYSCSLEKQRRHFYSSVRKSTVTHRIKFSVS